VVAAEGAKRAPGGADVGVVDVAVDDVGAVILGVHHERSGVGPGAEVVQRGGVIKLQGLRVGEAGFAFDDGVDVEGELHGGLISV
jgi:hypothetical protein